MNVMIVSELFYPRMRGGEVVLWRIARALAQRGHRVQVVTSRLEGTTSRETISGVEIRRPIPLAASGKSTSWRKAVSKVVFMAKLYLYLGQRIANERPDVIYNNAYAVTLPCGLLGRQHDVPVVTDVGNLQGRMHLIRGRLSLIGRVQILKEWIVLRFAGHHAIRAATNSVAQRVQPMTRAQIWTIPNPIDDQAARNALESVDRQAVRMEHDITKHELMLLFVGALEPVKNVEGLINVLADVSRPYKLLIAGSGSRETQLRAQVKDRGMDGLVQFLGQQRPQRVLELMAASDAVLLPSRSELFGLVVLEALSVGTPCISTSVGIAAEITHRKLTVVDTVLEIKDEVEGGIAGDDDWDVSVCYSTDRISLYFEKMFEDVIHQEGQEQH